MALVAHRCAARHALGVNRVLASPPSASVSAISGLVTHGLRRLRMLTLQRHAARALFWVSCATGGLLALTLPLWWLALGLCFEGEDCRHGHLLALVDNLLGLLLAAVGIAAGRAWMQHVHQDSRSAEELEAEFWDR